MDTLNKFFHEKEWNVVHSFEIEAREGKYREYSSLGLSSAAKSVLAPFPKGIYEHQWMAIKQFQDGANVCISTSTSSGKTLVFNICAVEKLASNHKSRVLAIYPLKALSSEQEERWRTVAANSGLKCSVGRIDGAVAQSEREKIIKNADIVIMTPDVVHAWLLSKIGNSSVAKFIKNISLIVIDEAHTYSGVFGSNSAFLFRRIEHLISLAGGACQFIAASATIHNPAEHMKKLTGVDYSIIGNEHETSPRKKNRIVLVNPPKSVDLLTALSNLMRAVVKDTQHQFITFVDSRKQTEYISAIASRKGERDRDDDEGVGDMDLDLTKDLPVCPYRSGYEETDRNRIQKKLSSGELKGVVSTSALEMGIDIPHLTLGILVGVPSSATSYYQRIGRVGRHKDGIILIVNNGSIQTEAIFREPERLSAIPLSESALYLENPRIQYIHALCLVRQGGEDDSIKSWLGREDDEFLPEASFPPNFVALCNSERIGEISSEFQTMKAQAGEDPNHLYPLRDVDIQYKVECREGPHLRNLGSLGFSQVMREAYPGAVYYYQTQTFRVFRLPAYKHLIEVRREKRYTTKPKNLPTLIFPNLSEGNVLQSKKYGDLTIIECNLQIRESIAGLTESRGRTEIEINYPLDKEFGLYFDVARFTRNYFTTGLIINHKSLDRDVKVQMVADIIYEAFFMVIPFERQDIGRGSDKHRADRDGFSKGNKFVSIFDQTYGSLRLTSRFLEHDVISKVFECALDIAENDPRYNHCIEEIEVIKTVQNELKKDEEQLCLDNNPSLPLDESLEKIIMPNSVGLDVRDGRNEEFFVEDIFYSPKLGLTYKGRHLSETGKRMATATETAGVTIIIIPVTALREIPGESETGTYNYDTGDIVKQIYGYDHRLIQEEEVPIYDRRELNIIK